MYDDTWGDTEMECEVTHEGTRGGDTSGEM